MLAERSEPGRLGLGLGLAWAWLAAEIVGGAWLDLRILGLVSAWFGFGSGWRLRRGIGLTCGFSAWFGCGLAAVWLWLGLGSAAGRESADLVFGAFLAIFWRKTAQEALCCVFWRKTG